MEVIVDGERNFSLTGAPSNVVSAVGEINAFLQEKGRAILTLLLDGKQLEPLDLSEPLGEKPLEEVKTLEVRSEALTVLIRSCLSELEEVLPELPQACHDLAEVFQGENPEEGFEHFVELANIWGFIKKRQSLVAGFLKIDLASLVLEGVSLRSLHEELNAILNEAAEALKTGDCILLGDLLEYELASRAEQEAQIVALLQEQASVDSCE